MDFSSFLQVQAAPCAEEQPPHGAFYGIQRVPFWSHLTQLCSSISQACAANWSFNMLFLQQQSLVWWQTSHGSWVLYLNWINCLLVSGLSEALHQSSLAFVVKLSTSGLQPQHCSVEHLEILPSSECFQTKDSFSPIMSCFLCDALVTRHRFIGHQLGVNQLVCTLSKPFCTSLHSCVQYFFCVFSQYYT